MSSILQGEKTLGQLRCGACGYDQFKLMNGSECLFVECAKCESVSHLEPTRPQFRFEWGEEEKDTGVPCVF